MTPTLRCELCGATLEAHWQLFHLHPAAPEPPRRPPDPRALLVGKVLRQVILGDQRQLAQRHHSRRHRHRRR